MIDNKVFTGKMNLDADNYRLPPGDYRYALNITRDARGQGQDKVVSNIVGTTRYVGASLPSGTNKCIGAREDLIRNRVYFFVWNSEGKHQIRYYDAKELTSYVLLESETDSDDVDILEFDPSWKINHIDIIYRDDDGDFLFWTDGLNRPRVLNVQEAIDDRYGTSWKAAYIELAKYMPLIAPVATYADDATVTVNNLRKTLYQFRYRWVYRGFFKSTWSPYGKLIAPANPDDVATQIDPEKNNRINVTIQTGDSDVIAIEIAARSILSTNVMSDDVLIATVEKGDTILSNTAYTYHFFNDGVYPNVDTDESTLLFDYVPTKAYTQALPNGNVLAYSAITEGITFDFDMDVVAETAMIAFSSDGPLEVVIEQVTSDVAEFNFIGEPATGDVVTAYVTIQDASVFPVVAESYTLFYTVQPGDTISDVETGIKAAFNAVPTRFTAIGAVVVNLTLPWEYVSFDVEVTLATSADTVDEVSNSIYKQNSKYRFGLVYFDDYGVTDGFNTTDELLVTTGELTTTGGLQSDIPNITMSIFHKPPLNAKYFSWVRSLNRTVQTFLPFVGCGTQLSGTNYQFIEVTNLQNNKFNYPIYEYAEGDRIRVIGIYSSGAAGTVAVYDFPVIGLVVNPTGITPTGTYIQIPYDATALLVATSKYYCEVYTPAITTDTGNEVLYEFGECYAISNPGTDERAHNGSRQSQVSRENTQVSTIVRPATEPTVTVAASAGNLGEGDYYYYVTFLDTDGNESEASDISAVGTTSAGNTQIDLSAIPTGAAGVTARNIYRTKVDELVPYFLATIADNVTTTYNDNIADSALLLQMPQPAIYNFTRGDVYSRLRKFPTSADLTTVNSVYVVIPSVSDLYPSTVNGNGRAFSEASEAEQGKYYPTLIRFGLEFQQDTTVNELNRFYFDNQDTYDRANGDVRKLHVEGRALYVFHKFDIGVVPILTQVVRDTSGNPLEANSDILLNKIQYPYKGKFGIGDVPESFAYYRNAKYFIDPNKGCACRLSQDGVTPISVVYQCNAFFTEVLPAYRKDLNTGIAPTGGVYTGDPTVYGEFDYYTNKYVIALEEINRYSDPDTLSFHQDPYTLIFNESRDETEGFECFASFHPEMMASLGTALLSWDAAITYVHNRTSEYCYFYQVQYDAEITAVFNSNSLQKKTYESIAEVSNTIWDCPEISTSSYSYGTTKQASVISSGAFRQFESMYSAAFKRDSNSRGGLINGDFLKGNWIQIKFRVENASNFVTLNIVSLRFTDSPLTTR